MSLVASQLHSEGHFPKSTGRLRAESSRTTAAGKKSICVESRVENLSVGKQTPPKKDPGAAEGLLISMMKRSLNTDSNCTRTFRSPWIRHKL